MIHFKK